MYICWLFPLHADGGYKGPRGSWHHEDWANRWAPLVPAYTWFTCLSMHIEVHHCMSCLGAHSHIRGLGLDDALEPRQASVCRIIYDNTIPTTKNDDSKQELYLYTDCPKYIQIFLFVEFCLTNSKQCKCVAINVFLHCCSSFCFVVKCSVLFPCRCLRGWSASWPPVGQPGSFLRWSKTAASPAERCWSLVSLAQERLPSQWVRVRRTHPSTRSSSLHSQLFVYVSRKRISPLIQIVFFSRRHCSVARPGHALHSSGR